MTAYNWASAVWDASIVLYFWAFILMWRISKHEEREEDYSLSFISIAVLEFEPLSSVIMWVSMFVSIGLLIWG